MSKKRRFLERADFLVAASRTFAATGQTTLRTYFLSTTCISRAKQPQNAPDAHRRRAQNTTKWKYPGYRPEHPPSGISKPGTDHRRPKFFFTRLLHEGVTTKTHHPPPQSEWAMERNEYNPVARLVLMRYKNYWILYRRCLGKIVYWSART